MYVYLGGDAVAREQDVVGIFDLDNTTVSKHTRAFLSGAEKGGNVVTTTWDIPKAFVVCAKPAKAKTSANIAKSASPKEKTSAQTVFLTQMAPATLRKRTALGERDVPTKEAKER